ncbi:GNAT family N-acetyltransferase [Arenibacter sp. TNZ]|uniref:GNAT family N-acetyltransferase n=1 Tax=Arenibacter TaxID=178469 RepID=UPI000CD3AFE4|nr:MULTISPECIES: GNAT family N-acetyltransferase [Arenibacter]MCM4172574.1 GNAT family N-acetyltransferase [Arenibacter sp. TNZ]
MLKRLNFSHEFFEKNSIFPFYKGLYNKTNGDIFINNNKENSEIYISDISIVQYIPPYFELKIDKKSSSYGLYKFNTYTGYKAVLDNFNNVEEYMKAQFSKGVKKTINSRHKRLEVCFDINYEMFYGSINQKKYIFLMDYLESMINTRFSQRNQEHSGLKKWAFYKDAAYQLILDKRASVFVISDGEKPIVIGLNFHYQNIFDSAITSYDIDYAKFGLGNIAVLKKIEWCFANGFSRYDMRWGELAYKSLWCNSVEPYECHIVYNKGNIGKKLGAYLVAFIMKFKTYLRNKGILPIKPKIRSFLKRNSRVSLPINSTAPDVELVDLTETVSISDHIEVDIINEDYSFLRKIIYDFQYINSEHSDNLTIYKMCDRENTYIISGKNKTQQIIFK